MGFLSWLRGLFSQPAAPPRRRSAPGRKTSPRNCPACGKRLRTALAQQCLHCGASWHHDEESVGGSRRPLESNLGVATAAPPRTLASTHLRDSVAWQEELPPPANLREALELGPLAPPPPRQPPRPRPRPAATAEPAPPVARRPVATDRVSFLGRGVSRQLSQAGGNEARLQSAGLPVFHTAEELAAALALSPSRLRWLAFHATATTRPHYISFEVAKRSGGVRQLAAPHEELSRCQHWILSHILNGVPVDDAAHGFVRQRGIVTNAAIHVGQDVLVNADLQDFFPSITYVRVRGIFASLGYAPSVATVLALLCTECPRQRVSWQGTTWHIAKGIRSLPQGACTSPALSNLAARRLDRRLSGLARKLAWQYSRYADDLSFSASGLATARTAYLLHRLRRIATEEDFAVNEAKTRVLRQNTAQTVTGVVVNRRPGVPRTLVRQLRAMLHRARHEGLAAQNRTGRPDFESWLAGTIAYIRMVNRQQGEPLQTALAAIRAATDADGHRAVDGEA